MTPARRMKAMVRFISVLAVLALIGTACGDSAGTTTAAPEATTATTQPAATTQPPPTTQATTTTTVEVAPTGSERVSFEELIGTWWCFPCSSFLHLNEDGTYRIVSGPGDILPQDIEGATVEQGQFTLEGTLFTLISNEDSQNCETGQRGSYEMEVLEEGLSGADRMKMIQVEDECTIRGSVGNTTFERVLITAADFVGTWKVDEPSYARFNEDGTYELSLTLDGLDEPIEQGRFTVDGNVFTFISGDTSTACRADERGRYEIEVIDEDRLRQVLIDDECALRGSTGDVILERVS